MTDTNVGNNAESVRTGNENIDTLLEVSEKVKKKPSAPEAEGVNTLVETVEKLNNKTASTEETGSTEINDDPAIHTAEEQKKNKRL